ncbi:6852_t:CDS:2, partial [Racocetra persica]
KNGLSKSKRPVSRISLPEERQQEREQYFHNVPPEANLEFSQIILSQNHFQSLLPEEHQQKFRSYNRPESYATDKTDLTCVSTDHSNNFKPLNPPNPIHVNTDGSQQNLIPIHPNSNSEAPPPTISYPVYDNKSFNFLGGDPSNLSSKKFGKSSKKSRRKLWIFLALLFVVILLIIVISVIVVKVNNAAAQNSQSNNDLASANNLTGTNSTTGSSPINDSSSTITNSTDINPSGSLPTVPTPTESTPTVSVAQIPSSCPSPVACTISGQVLCPPIDGSQCNYYCNGDSSNRVND